jgi:hypothetical protein
MGHDGNMPRRLTRAQSVQQALLHFLRTGMLPWWFRLASGERLEDAVTVAWSADDPPDTGRGGWPEIISLLAASPTARVRLSRQFSAMMLDRLLRRLSPAMADAVASVVAITAHQTLPEMARQLQERLWQAAFLLAAQGRPATGDDLHHEWARLAVPDGGAAEDAVRKITAISPETAGKQASGAAPEDPAPPAPGRRAPFLARDAPDGELDLDEGLFVENAGLVLLHPFLPALFERLGVAADDVILQPDRALALLHVLATGNTPAPEYRLLVPKLLCGLPLDEPAPAPIELTKEDLEEAAALLTAVIGHWEALADASPNALRGTFLTRPGKLSIRGGDWLLQLEQRSFDVLLDRLPWSIGAVRLPWMTRLLWVEWRM